MLYRDDVRGKDLSQLDSGAHCREKSIERGFGKMAGLLPLQARGSTVMDLQFSAEQAEKEGQVPRAQVRYLLLGVGGI